MTVVRQLLSLAQAEERLIAENRIDELEALYSDRDALIARLPDRLPGTDIAILEAAVGLQRACAERLRLARDEVAGELVHLDTGRATLRAYAPAGVRHLKSVDATG
jgi:hypothetical protein